MRSGIRRARKYTPAWSTRPRWLRKSIAATSKKLATKTLTGLGDGTTATVSLTYPIAKCPYGLMTIGVPETVQNQLSKFTN